MENRGRQETETLHLINAINQAANQGASLQEIMDLFCTKTGELFDANSATLYLLDKNGKHLIPQTISLPPSLVGPVERVIGKSIPEVRIPVAPGSLYHRILHAGKAQIIDDPKIMRDMMAEHADSPALRKLVPVVSRTLNYGAVLSVPLAVEGEVLGLLDMGRRGPFTEEDLKQFEVLAEQFTVIIKRKQDEANLGRVRKEWERIFQAIGHPTVILDPQHRVIAANKATVNAAGIPAKELVGRQCYEVFHGTGEPPQACPLKKMLASAGMEMVEMTMAAFGGTFLVSCTPVLDDAGRLEKVIHIATDITARVDAQQALRESEAQLKKSQEIAHVGSWHLELNGGRMTWSDEVYRILGLQPGSVEATYAAFLYGVHPDDREKVGSEIRSAQKERRPYEITHRVLHPNGAVRVAHQKSEVLTDESGEPYASVGIIRDITDRVSREREREQLLEQIRDQARQLQEVINSVPEGMLLLDASGWIMLANPVADRYLDVLATSPDDTLPFSRAEQALRRLGDRPFSELLEPPAEGLWHEVKARGRTFEVVARPTAQSVGLTAGVGEAMEPEPESEHWVMVIYEVTQEHLVREQLRRQERLAVVGQLAAGIAHDFNNIMGTIVLYASMAARSERLSERGQEWIATIGDQAHRATNLIQQILDFSRRSVLERRPIDLLLLVKEEVQLLERTLPEHISIDLTYGHDEYTVDADPTRIQQVVTNLAVNARDAMPDGGRLHLALERRAVKPGDSPPVPGMEAGDWVVLSVTDTGVGIAREHLPHIFEPFFTTKEPGTGAGLGLAQVHGIVGQHGGHLDLATVVGKGTSFTIFLPGLPVRATASARPAPVEPAKGRGETVLVVEDEATLRGALAETIRSLNYRVLEAGNGIGALDVLQRHEVALVLSDVIMPRMGGISLLNVMRERNIDLPMVLLTGHPMEEELEELLASGLSAYLLKPPRVEELADLMAELLGGTG
jgi:PAS domain S-box-containing protein